MPQASEAASESLSGRAHDGTVAELPLVPPMVACRDTVRAELLALRAAAGEEVIVASGAVGARRIRQRHLDTILASARELAQLVAAEAETDAGAVEDDGEGRAKHRDGRDGERSSERCSNDAPVSGLPSAAPSAVPSEDGDRANTVEALREASREFVRELQVTTRWRLGERSPIAF